MQLLANLGVNASKKRIDISVEAGLIVIWYGQSNTIPAGWALCDGTNGNPDLRDRFIIGAGDEYSIGATGGFLDTPLIEHTHTASVATNNSTAHFHRVRLGFIESAGQAGFQDQPLTQQNDSRSTSTAGAHTHTVGTLTISTSGSSPTNTNLPPYRGLFYIIKEVT